MKIPYWTGFQGKKLWDWLDLLLVPLMLALGIALIEVAEGRREEYNLDEQYRQQLLRDYFNDLKTLVFDGNTFDTLLKAKSYDSRKELLGSRTIALLEILEEDKSRKEQVIRFVGNAGLSRIIPIRRANLTALDLSYVDLSGADLRTSKLNGTNLEGANLKEAYLCTADLSKANFEGTDLTDAYYSDETIITEGVLSAAQLNSMNKKSIDSCGPNEEVNLGE